MVRLFLAGLALAVSQVVLPARATAAPLDEDPRFPRVAQIKLDNCDPACGADGSTKFDPGATKLIVDSSRRRIYAYNSNDRATFPRGIAVIDIDRGEQTAWVDLAGTKLANPDSNSFTAMTYDEPRGRLFLGETSVYAGCTFGFTANSNTVLRPHQGCATPSRIAMLDLTQRHPVPVLFRVNPAVTSNATSVGDGIAALAYDTNRQRLYVLTSGGSSFESQALDPKGPSVVAFDANSIDASSAPLWPPYRPRACATVLGGSGGGRPYFDVANDGSFVYFGCRGTPLPVVPHGVVRVNLDDTPGNPTEGFTTEFFPFAGLQVVAGFTLGDAGGDRIALASTGTGAQRLYVFDAVNRAWVGSMLLAASNNGDGGSDPGSGRIYVGGNDGLVRVIDAAALPTIIHKDPVTLGFDFTSGGLPPVVVDPLTRVVAVPGSSSGFNTGSENKDHIWLFKDEIPPFVPAEPIDPDDRTHDIDESDAVQVSHTAFGSAFGAHSLFVRGVKGLPLVSNLNETLGNRPETEPLELEGGDRGLFLSQVTHAELTGESDYGTARAGAVAARIDAATEADLRGKYGRVPISSNEALSYDALMGNAGRLEPSSCTDFGNDDDPTEGSSEGSKVSCRRLGTVTATSSASPLEPIGSAGTSASIASSSSHVETVKDSTGGVITRSTAIARGVNVTVPGAGAINIGEISATAVSRAEGRPNRSACEAPEPRCTRSVLTTVAKNVRLVDADGTTTLFACGVPGVPAEDDPCVLEDIARAIDQNFGPRVQARGPRQELHLNVVNSPGGARAVVMKDQYAFWNDATINGDAQREVVGLNLAIYNDGAEASRLIVKLAGVYSEAQYQIGAPKPPDIVDATKLSIALIDDAGEPLEGGVFQVREPDALGLGGPLVATCVTAVDGIGDCSFEGLPPGDYTISETAAPAGYAAADDAEITLDAGFHTEVVFTNLRAVGQIDILLTDDGGEAGVQAPLAGAVFGVYADDGDLKLGAGDLAYAECTTDAQGSCSFSEVPLGAYVVHEKRAPKDYLTADDVGFELKLPGQRAQLAFVTGLVGIEGTPGSPPRDDDSDADSDEGIVVEETPRDTAFVDEPTETTTVIIEEPPMRPAAQVSTSPLSAPQRGGLGRVIALPGEALAFVRRQPLQAVLFAAFWLLLGAPVYLAIRRRNLTIVKEVV